MTRDKADDTTMDLLLTLNGVINEEIRQFVSRVNVRAQLDKRKTGALQRAITAELRALDADKRRQQ